MAGKRKLTARQVRYLFATGRLRASGSGKNRKVTYSKDAGAPKRTVIGGSKAAGLRSGSGSGRRAPSKAERDKTRAARIEAGKAVLNHAQVEPTQKALRVTGFLYATKYRRPGVSVREAARGERQRIKDFEAREARDNRIAQARRYAGVNTRVQRFRGLEQQLGRDGAIRATKTRSARIAAGRAIAAEFTKKRRQAYNPLF